MPLREDKPLPPLDEYRAYFKHCRNEKYVLEASPSYLYGEDKIASAIRASCGGAKILVILREPVERLNSYYGHLLSKTILEPDENPTEFVRKSILAINQDLPQNYFARGVKEGFYSDYLPAWFNTFGDDLKIVFFDDLKKNPADLLNNITAWLGIPPIPESEKEFTIENKTIHYRIKFLHRAVLFINSKAERFWRKNHRAKILLRKLYYRLNADKEKSVQPDEQISHELRELYRPYNRTLRDILTEKGYKDLPSWINQP